MSHILKVGQKIEVTGKSIQGEVAYIGNTGFATGRWIGLILDEPKGKNNGSVNGKAYFQCKPNHGMFVRQTQLSIITDTGSKLDLSSPSSVTSPDDTAKNVTPKSRLTSIKRKSSPASHAPPSRTSSRQSLSGRSRESRSREDMSSSTSSVASVDIPSQQRKASFIEKVTPKWTRQSSSKSHIPTASQTGFVETLKPQFTPGQVTPTPSNPLGGSRLTLVQEPNQDFETLKENYKDLGERLETMRVRYKEKTHELETMNLQIQQSVEFKSKIMEAQASLKRELEKVKKEKEEALHAREEMSDMADTLEMATLDKEMAEEKAEALQKEYEQAQEKICELEMELEILKSELADKVEGVTPTEEGSEISSLKMKQLLQQNDKLKDTLVRLRDLSAHEKHEKQKLLKDFEENQKEFDTILKTNEKLKAQIAQMEEQMEELHANVDAALGAEEMVETLGQQKLTLEEKVKELEEAVNELEELQEVNDQLQEGFKEQEQDFRQELDLKNQQIWEAQRKTEQVLESLADRELTISKFRDLVQRIQEDNQELRSQLMTSKSSSMSSLMPEMIDFKKMFAETKAHARAIELELRHMEVQQAQQHVQYLISFMPDTFLARGGDGDAVLLVLLMPRLLAKCQVLVSQLRDKFPAITNIDKTSITPAQQYSAISRFSAHIHLLQGILHQFIHCMNTCKPETLLKVGASYLDMAQQEKALDAYIEMLKREQVDEHLNTTSLEKIVTYFNTVHPQLLLSSGDCSIHEGQLLSDVGKAVLCALDSIQTDINIINALVPEGQGVETLKKVMPFFESLRTQLRHARRRSDLPNLLFGPNWDLTVITKPIITLSKILAPTASKLAVTPTDVDNPIDPSRVMELLKQSFDKNNDLIGDKERNVEMFIEIVVESVTTHVNNIVKSLHDNEEKYISLKIKEGQEPPLVARSKLVKEELNSMAGIKRKMESREEDVKELKLSLRAKQEELAEMILRKDLAEKKLTTVIRDHEITVETLKRKYDESCEQLIKKEKEFEKTLDHLQKDIDSLEVEKGELKHLLKSDTKKVGETEKYTLSSISKPSDIRNAAPGTIKVVESPILREQISYLNKQLRQERKKNMSETAKNYMAILDKLEPIHVPKKMQDEDTKRIETLQKKLNDLRKEYLDNLPVFPDLSGKKYEQWKTILENQIKRNIETKEIIREKVICLQNEIVREVARQKKGAVLTDLTLFPSPELVKVMKENKVIDLCEITLPTSDPELKGKTITLNVEMKTFIEMQNHILQMNN